MYTAGGGEERDATQAAAAVSSSQGGRTVSALFLSYGARECRRCRLECFATVRELCATVTHCASPPLLNRAEKTGDTVLLLAHYRYHSQ